MSTLAKPVHATGTIIRNERLTPTVSHITIKTELPRFKPGQFCWLTLEREDQKLKKPYSMASAPWEKDLVVCIKEVPDGTVSKRLTKLSAGTELDVFSPLGLFILPEDEKGLLFIAVGTGVAPFRSMIRELFKKHYSGQGTDTERHVTLLYGCKTEEEILYEEEFEGLAEERENFKYHIALTREEKEGRMHGRVQEHLDRVLTKDANVFLCGIRDMVIDVNKALVKKGVPANNIHLEIY